MQTQAFKGWRMVLIGLLAQNAGVSMTLAAYGTSLTIIEADLGVSRTLAATVPALMLLSLGVLSPVVGSVLQRFSLRNAMTVGALLCSLGHLLVGLAGNFTLVLLAYLLLIGPGGCLMGPITASTIVTRWFERDRGKALGIVNMPLFILLVPPVAAMLLLHGGRALLFCVLSAFLALIALLSRLTIDDPAQIGQTPRRHEGDDRSSDATAVAATPALSISAIIGDFRFWLVSLSVGITSGLASAYIAHAAPLALNRGIDLALAASLVSAFGGGSLLGALFFGWMIDRIGALQTLIVNAFAFTLFWVGVAYAAQFPPLLAISLLLGVCSGAIVALHGAVLTILFGARTFSKALGIGYLLKLPFLVVSAPLAGHIFDVTHEYTDAGLGAAALTTIAGLMAIWLFAVQRSRMQGNLVAA